ncbi:MAG: FadR family transcriptional regulator [Deltaproteobacteria bacterium]|nr:FadR family transcriptional regulator [Deltaproteobacteria bacterium]MBW2138898.1 FadR family transcriptional regulator [Deltaproteobacteria bacterium]
MQQAKKLFSPIDNKRAFESVSSEIKKLILSGVLKPGDRLPSEAEIASQFKVGRQTVREALRILELSGFVSVQKGYGGGPVVKNTVINQIASLLLDTFQMGDISLEQITSARVVIEKAILDAVIEKADQSDIRRLRENTARAWERAENGLLCLEENLEFHRLLAKASRNPVFVIFIEAIVALLRNFHTLQLPDEGTCGRAIKSHEKILDSIIKRDRKKAMYFIERHFNEVRDRLQSLVAKGEIRNSKMGAGL